MQKSYDLQTIDAKITNLLKPLFQGTKKEFVIINNLVKNWHEIIGEKYAKLCHPKAISFDKSQKNIKLTIAVYNPAIGFFIEQNSQLILERISALYGFNAIGKIIIKQEPKNVNLEQKSEIKLSQKKEDFLQQKIKEVQDQDLAKTLTALGREVFKENDK